MKKNQSAIVLPPAMNGKELKRAKESARKHGISLNEYLSLMKRTQAENK
jgi:hypothetical protein